MPSTPPVKKVTPTLATGTTGRAGGYSLSFSKAEEDLFSASRERVERPVDRGVITIHSSTIQLPEHTPQTDSIRLE